MALGDLSAFAAGFAAGWLGRSIAGSTREALVHVIVISHRVRDDVRRALGERAEWIEDLIAEGRMRYESAEPSADGDAGVAPPNKKRAGAGERAA